MLKIVLVALVVVELVLLTAFALPPADATSSDFETYVWSFAGVGSNQVVCKKIVMHPEQWLQTGSSDRKVIEMNTTSAIVSDSYCANSAKPYQAAS